MAPFSDFISLRALMLTEPRVFEVGRDCLELASLPLAIKPDFDCPAQLAEADRPRECG